jgi:hypothetical protein
MYKMFKTVYGNGSGTKRPPAERNAASKKMSSLPQKYQYAQRQKAWYLILVQRTLPCLNFSAGVGVCRIHTP